MRVSPATLSGIVTLLACSAVLAQVRSSPHDCDPLVDVRSQGPGAYKQRGDRCEGEYEQKVSGGTGIRVVSLTDTGPEVTFSAEDTVHLAWTTDGSVAVRLRAISLRFRHYYRMDAARPAGSSTWVWPADVLSGHRLTTREIGLLGVTRREFVEGERDVYVPIRMAKNSAPQPDSPYTLVVVPDATLQRLYLTITPLKPDGNRDEPLFEDTDLRQGPYPARGGIRVPLPLLSRRGYYLVELAGVTDSSKPVSVELTLYHGR